MNQVEVRIMGQGYLLGCPEGGEDRLKDAVARVDAAMCKIRDAGKIKARDRIAVLAALNLAFDLGENGTLELSPSMTFGSSVWTRATFSANERVPNWELYNASLTYKPVSEKYSVQLFVRNIGDEPVYTGSEQYPFLGAYTGHDINAPRTFGARFHYNF